MSERLGELLGLLFQAHPWHGVSSAQDAQGALTAFVEIVPTDVVKYEVDKPTGLLKIDRPQRFSNLCPTLYGFIPQTYCGDRVGARSGERTGRAGVEGDGDPLDVCILTERAISQGGILLRVRPIGGLRMVEAHQADDKIIAVLEGDAAYGGLLELSECPKGIVERLEHYFLTYKQLPDGSPRRVEIPERYDRGEAYEVIRRSREDYVAKFGDPEDRLREMKRLLRE